jgi:hypothetical protein
MSDELGLSMILAWTIIPFACFMVFVVVRDIWLSSKLPNFVTTLQPGTIHRNRTVG